MRGRLLFGAAAAALLMFAPVSMAQDGDQPGDASTQATVAVGAVTEGELAPEGDVDWYRLRMERGQRYTLTLDGVADENGDAVDTMLGVYDSDGNQLAFNDDSGGTLNSEVTYVPQRDGDVFVEARAFSDAGAGRYRLAVAAVAVPPDDAGNDATTRARVAPGRATNGVIEYEGDFDWYRLNARNSQRYTISLDQLGAHGLADPILRVIDRDGNELASNDDSEDSLNSRLEFIPPSNGEVFIEARGYADAYTGAYTLSVSADALPTDSISATRNTRGRLAINESVTSALDFPTDRDWYRVRLEAGESYRILVNSAGADPLSDPLVRMLNAQGEQLAMDDDGGEGLNSYLEFTAPTTGVYYVEARGFSDEATGGYTISMRAGDIPSDATTDVTLSADGDYRDGVLSPGGDRDWYRVELAEGQGMRLSLNSGDGADALGDPYLVVYDSNGAEVARDDDSGEGLNSWLEYQAPTAGAYYIEARGFSDGAVGAYILGLTPGEIGATPSEAEYIAAGGEGRTSYIGAPGDIDWFAIELVEGRPYRFSVVGDELPDPVLTLYDAQGNEVASDDDGGTGLDSYLSFTSVTGGSYFAAVSGYSENVGRYTLRVADTDVPGSVYTDENLDAQEEDDRTSRIDIAGDLDNYRVLLEEGVTYVIEVTASRGGLSNPFVALLDSGGERVAFNDDGGAGRNARLRFRARETGEYFIQASGVGGSTGSYQVSIVRQ